MTCDGLWHDWQLATPGTNTSEARLLVSAPPWQVAQAVWVTCGACVKTNRSEHRFGNAYGCQAGTKQLVAFQTRHQQRVEGRRQPLPFLWQCVWPAGSTVEFGPSNSGPSAAPAPIHATGRRVDWHRRDSLASGFEFLFQP